MTRRAEGRISAAYQSDGGGIADEDAAIRLPSGLPPTLGRLAMALQSLGTVLSVENSA